MIKKIIGFVILVYIIGSVCLFVYRAIKDEVDKKCVIEKFGVEYNERRKALTLTELSPNWTIEHFDSCIIWSNPNDKHLGHRWKNISFKNCKILNELDLFSFEYDPHLGRYSKVLEVEAIYDENETLESIIYSFQTGTTVSRISKQEADSLINTLN